MKVGKFLLINNKYLTRIKKTSWNIVRRPFLNNQLKLFREWAFIDPFKASEGEQSISFTI